MLLSILIPTYNRPNELIIAIKSCLDFLEGQVEIIVGDDGQQSNLENIKGILLPSNYTLRYLHRETPLKQNKNVADLISNATGDYSLILHDDDYLLAGGVNALINTAKKNLDLGLDIIYFGKQQMVNENNQVIKNNSLNENYFRVAELKGLQTNSLKMALLQQVPSNSFLLPTKIAKDINYRDHNFVGDACDFDFIARLVLAGKCELYFINSFISAYRLSSSSVSRSTNYNSIFYKYKILKELKIDTNHPEIYKNLLNNDLNVLCGYYINHNHKRELNQLYFSPDYPLKNKISLRGIYHLLRCFI